VLAYTCRLLIAVGVLGLFLPHFCVYTDEGCFQLQKQDLLETKDWGRAACWQLPQEESLVLTAPASITGPCTLDFGWRVDLLRLGGQ
jgi:hypothetical protein